MTTHYQKYGKKWYEKNKESELLRGKEYYKLNKEKKRSKYLSRRDQILQNRYGITENDYLTMLVAQCGCCAICNTDFSTTLRNLDVDHDHDTGKVRGLLCNNCNRGLGHFQDDPILLERAVLYLNASGKGGSCGG